MTILKGWHCQDRCGACCYLQPSERPDLADYLTQAELAQYLALVGADGWCRHYDRATRQCTIYAARPGFCRVSPANFQRMYGVGSEEFDAFAVNCCFEQIADTFGPTSPEFERYCQAYGLNDDGPEDKSPASD